MSTPFGGAATNAQWSISKSIVTSDGTISLLASPGTGRKIVVCSLDWIITTTAAQTYTIGDGTITLFTGPASHAVNWYGLNFGDAGIPLTAATAFQFIPSAAGYAMTIAAHGYYMENPTKAYHS